MINLTPVLHLRFQIGIGMLQKTLDVDDTRMGHQDGFSQEDDTAGSVECEDDMSDDDEKIRDVNYFEEVTKAVILVATPDAGDEEDLQSPSNTIKLSHDVKKLASIKLAKPFCTGDDIKRRESKDFLTVITINFSTKLAQVLLSERRFGVVNHCHNQEM